ncbi:MAG: arginine--tRNA ligase [Flavobacteriia bacterium]|nr:arginine--tRNA ligase [Flavobacteriia bacterium]
MILKIKQIIAQNANQLFGNNIDEKNIVLQQTKKEFQGDLTLLVFPLAKFAKKNPIELAQELGTFLLNSIIEITHFNVVQGFLNLSFSKQYWYNELIKIDSTPSFGFSTEKKSLIMVEFASPNTNKPLHLGHLRNIFLGNSVAEILKANGHEVLKTQIINDRGIHICKSMLAWIKFSPINSNGEKETPSNTGMKGDKLVGKYYVEFDKQWNIQTNDIYNKWLNNNFDETHPSVISEYEKLFSSKIGKEEKIQIEIEKKIKELAKNNAPILVEAKEMLIKWEARDPEVYLLWSTMNGWVYKGFEETYKKLQVQFDKNYYESDTYLIGKEAIDYGLKKGVFYQKEDSSIWVNLENEGLDEKLLLRSDGTAVYMTQDIGTAYQRFLDFPKLAGMVYTVGNEQDYHFKVLFHILKKLGFEWAKDCVHLSYGMVDLPSGKMKSREGTVVDADDLIEDLFQNVKILAEERGHLEGMNDEQKNSLYHTVSTGALAYYLLKVDPRKRMMFNPEESVELNGNTGPFIQYTFARIQSLLKKAKYQESQFIAIVDAEIEIDIIKKLQLFPSIVEEAAKSYSPSLICQYVYELAKDFNNLYQNVPILIEENVVKRNLLLTMSKNVGKVIQTGMKLLSINVPEKM